MGEESTTPLTAGSTGPAVASGPAPSTDPLRLDLQSLLAGAVQQLRESAATERALAWTLDPEGRPIVVAAAYSGKPPQSPDSEELACLAGLDRATALSGAAADPELGRIGERHSCAAAVAVAPRGGGAPAVLLLGGVGPGGERDAPPRPRALAALDAAAARLAAPFSAALAVGRLYQLDSEMRRLDRLASLGTLAAEIVHEVRNPLVSVKTFMQLLPERRDDPELLTRFLDLVNDELRRMERLLDLVLDHARPPGESTSGGAALAVVVESVADLLAHRAATAGISLRTRVAPDLPEAALSEDALRQVVLNLALNAIAATRKGGSVELVGKAVRGSIRLVVCDDGPGVPPELRDSLFDPFVTTRSDRAGGLGLSITRRIVEESGGRIAVGDSASGGAEFRVDLPRLTGPRAR